MGVEEIDGECGVFGASSCKDFDVVVSYSIDVFGTGFGERVWKGFDQCHLTCSWERSFIIMVSKYCRKGDFALDEEFSKFKDCLQKLVKAEMTSMQRTL